MKSNYISWTIGLLMAAALITFTVYETIMESNALKNSDLVVAEIESFEPSRGATTVNVRYKYKGKIVYNRFGTYKRDSLRIKARVWLKISKQYPSKYIDFVSVFHPLEGKSDQRIKDEVDRNYRFDFETNFNQFYLSDELSSGETNSLSFWRDTALRYRLAQDDGILGIKTACYGHVGGELHIIDKPVKNIEFDKYDHIVEAGIEIKSTILKILDCPNSDVKLEVKVDPGAYRVRVYSSNLSSASKDHEEGNDYYKIELWPDTNLKRKMLKEYTGN